MEAGKDSAPAANLSAPRGSVDLEPGSYRAVAVANGVERHAEFEVTEGRVTPVEVAFGPAMLRVAAAESRDSEPLKDYIQWRVWKIEANGRRGSEPVQSKYAIQPTFLLDAGRYLVSLERGETQAETEVTLTDGKRESVLLIIGSGTLKVRATRNEKPVTEYRSFEVYQAGQHGMGEATKLASKYSFDATFQLPAGNYLVAASDGPARVEAKVTIDEGKLVETVLDFQTGTIEASASRTGNPLKTYRTYQVFRAGTLGGEPIDSKFAIRTKFTLTPGEYVVRAEDGTVFSEVKVTVEPGGSHTAVLDFQTGEVKAVAVTADGVREKRYANYSILAAGTGKKSLRPTQPPEALFCRRVSTQCASREKNLPARRTFASSRATRSN